MWTSNHDGSDREEVTDSEKIVLAFGRNGGSETSRNNAAKIVGDAHAAKRWFFCDCRKGAVLIPVVGDRGTHVRRKTPQSSAHHEDCPFAVEPKEQFFVVKSLRSHSPEVPFSLLRNIVATSGQDTTTSTTKETYSTRRPGLARLLVSIAEASTIQRHCSPSPNLGTQFKSIKDHAAKFLLAPSVPVRNMLCSDTARYSKFVEDFDTKSHRQRWTGGIREHGILLDAISGVEKGHLVCRDGARLPVFGNISIFGRADAPVKDWSTYFVVGLIGHVSFQRDPCLIRAYLHPCMSKNNLMLVDSNYERETLKYIIELQTEYRDLIKFVIKKPLTDIGNQPIEDGITEKDAEKEANLHGGPKILIPDFILSFPDFANGKQDIIVETLGFSWPSYREDKKITIPAMQAALKGIAVVQHDFHYPKNKSQEERNDSFKDRLRALIEERVSKLSR